jgi:nucleotide-binding universal stress UspA family protein
MPTDSPKLLICYDGSDRAKHAVQVTAKLFPGAPALVLHVWEPVEHIVARYAVLAPYLGEQVDEADKGAEHESQSVADEGAALASAAGLAASAHTATLRSTVWQAVLESAATLGADIVITGTRSLHGVQELLAGTLSHALLQHGQLPLLAIPMAD